MGREPERSRPFYFRGCDLTAEYLLATEEVRAQLPAAAPILQQSSQRQPVQPSLQNSACSGAARGQPAILFRGRGRKVMHLPCKQAQAGRYPPSSTISLRGE